MLTEKDYSEIHVNQVYFVEYEFNGEKHSEIMDGDILLEIENGGYDVIKYRLLTKLEKGAIYLVQVPDDMDMKCLFGLEDYLKKEAEIKPIIVNDNTTIKKLPDLEKNELFEYVKKELGIED